MAPWELPEFFGERVERGRRLLAEREEYQGSADLQAFIRDMDLTVALHRTFIGEDGQAWQGLSEREQQQGLVTFLCGMICKLSLPEQIHVLAPACWRGLRAEIESRILGDSTSLRLLRSVGLSASQVCQPDDPPFGQTYSSVGDLEWSSCMAAAEELERYQQAQGFDPVLSAEDMRRLIVLLQHFTASNLAATLQGSAAAHMRAVTERAGRQLVALDPDSPAYRLKYMICVMSRPHELGAACRKAMQAAEDANAHYVRFQAGLQLVNALPLGSEGPHWFMSEARNLLGQVKESLALCKAWLPLSIYELSKERFAGTRLMLEKVAEHCPGHDQLPVPPAAALCFPSTFQVPQPCSGCGQPALNLRKCSACRAVLYCSTECQRRHWKAPGGHRGECAALAASRNA